jgi:CRISPR-associated endonuclease/helicase Cas3
MRLQLLPVYSKLADLHDIPPDLVQKLPGDLQLSQHQLETYRALSNPDIDAVINTAMTGDGKSLAGQLPLLHERKRTLALYPTNELILDQYRSATKTLEVWERDPLYNDPRNVQMLYGAVLDQLAGEAEFGGRSDQLLRVLENSRLLLSNPDIFHVIMQFGYQKGIAPDWIIGQLVHTYEQFTFDEFHIFDVTQVAAVITGLLFLYAQRRGTLKTLFLSATPGDTLIPLLERAGLRVRGVESEYCYDPAPDLKLWRQILQPAMLHLAPLRAEAWIDRHLKNTVLPFFKLHGKGAKGAIIVNSVATAQRLLTQLKEPLWRDHGLRVEDNTGLTPRSIRRDSNAADLLIGTSTVDVGVDFQINFLLFEASSAGTFMQRLGRLGRHTHYIDANNTRHNFSAFEAHALIPQFVFDRLTVGDQQWSRLLTPDQPFQRDTLHQAVQQAFPKQPSYNHYLPTWGRFQPAHVLHALRHKTIKASYADLIKPLAQQYSRVFSTPIWKTFDDAAEYVRQKQTKLVHEAQSFRGSSAFDCGVLRMDLPREKREPLTYDLFWLLENAHVELIDNDEFYAEVKWLGYNDTPFRRDREIAFFRLHSFLPERDDVIVNLDHVRGFDWQSYGQAVVIAGVRVDCARFPDLNQLNLMLARRSFAALLCPGKHPVEVQQWAYLPGMFPLHKFAGNNLTGTIAFGREALILDSILRHKPLKGAADMFFMC